jgi:hypothetical protein
MITSHLRRLTAIVFVAGTLGLASPAGAQSAYDLSIPRVGGGLTLTDADGVGVTGGILYPLRKYGEIRSLGLVLAGQYVDFDGFGQLSFGGGVRWTRLLENVTAVRGFRIYGQGVYGFSRVLEEDFGSNDHGFTVGGGAGFALTERVNAFGELNIARLTSPEFDFSYSGYVIILGVSVPFRGN